MQCKHRDWTCFYERDGKFLAHCQRCHREGANWRDTKADAERELLMTELAALGQAIDGGAEIFTR